jgi:hypothetical protein
LKSGSEPESGHIDSVSGTPDTGTVSRDRTEADLIRAAEKVSCELGSRDLKRYKQEGILQRSRQLHELGLQGSISLYPPETIGQIQAICVGRRLHYRYDELRFHLWWDGHWVEPGRLRETLRGLLSEQLAVLDTWLEEFGSVEEVAEAAAREAAKAQTRNPLLRLLRASVGARRDTVGIESLCYNLTLLAYGQQPVWTSPDVGADEDDEDVLDPVARAVFTTDTPGGRKTPPGDLRFFLEPERKDSLPATFRELIKLRILPFENLPRLLEAASAEELEAARDDVRAFSEDLSSIVEAGELVFGRGAFGLGALRAFRVKSSGLGLRVSLLPMMVAIRGGSPEMSNNLDTVKAAIRQASPKARRFLKLMRSGPSNG